MTLISTIFTLLLSMVGLLLKIVAIIVLCLIGLVLFAYLSNVLRTLFFRRKRRKVIAQALQSPYKKLLRTYLAQRLEAEKITQHLCKKELAWNNLKESGITKDDPLYATFETEFIQAFPEIPVDTYDYSHKLSLDDAQEIIEQMRGLDLDYEQLQQLLEIFDEDERTIK